MQDDFNQLLHLGDLAVPEDELEHQLYDLDGSARTGAYLLSEEDRVSLSQLVPGQIQEWCQSRITEHRSHNRFLRQRYGSAACNAISKNKSHIRALRSAYNDAAPIHQYLPPEMLMEIFSYVHPAVKPRPRIPVLRVCRYWRQLLFKTPRFWANLLSLPTWKVWNPRRHMGRFRAALARSAPESLTLSVPFSSQVIVDILTPHANRLSAFKVGPTLYSVDELAQILEQHMPHLTRLAILQTNCWYSEASTFNLKFGRYPNIRSIELERAHFYTPTVPYPSLRHLKLKYCTIRPSPTVTSGVPALRAMHDALEFFPNLETLSMPRSLMDEDPPRGSARPPCELTKFVPLPHLCLLEIEDVPAYIPRFLAHLVLPPTTALVLEPAWEIDYSQRPLAIPVYPGFNSSPCPKTELSMYLDFRPSHEDEELVRWETHGAGVRPVRVTLTGLASHTATVSRFTRELAEALAPAPARGVTSLTVEGVCFPRGPYWEHLLRELPGLRHFACGREWTTKKVVGALGGKRSTPGGEFLCARLEGMDLAWSLPNSVIEPGREEEWRLLQQDSIGGSWLLDVKLDPESESESKSPLATSLRKFCDTLGACLSTRAGHCAPIRKLSVSLHWDIYGGDSAVLAGWQVALVERYLRHALDHLVDNVAVGSEVSY